MNTPIDHIETLVSKAGELAETKLEIWKLKLVDKVATSVSSLIASIAIVLFIVAAIMILSLGAAVWIGTSLGQLSYGFFIVGGFYVLVGILLYAFRKSILKTPLSNLIIDKLAR
ncbi:MAG TPA: phage holin family protein [Chitinophagaceae bacterium]|nr:phage holin family protein [Chitinophagaceae bacterium]